MREQPRIIQKELDALHMQVWHRQPEGVCQVSPWPCAREAVGSSRHDEGIQGGMAILLGSSTVSICPLLHQIVLRFSEVLLIADGTDSTQYTQ